MNLNFLKYYLAVSDWVLMLSFVDNCTSFDPPDVVERYSDV